MKKLVLLLGLLLPTGGALAQSPVIPNTSASISIAGTVAARTKIITGTASTSIYISSLALVVLKTGIATLSAGTGANCGTNTVVLGVYGAAGTTNDVAISLGSGRGAVLVVPKGSDLCITIATAAAPGSLTYDQF